MFLKQDLPVGKSYYKNASRAVGFGARPGQDKIHLGEQISGIPLISWPVPHSTS